MSDEPLKPESLGSLRQDLRQCPGLDSLSLESWRDAFDRMWSFHGHDGVWAVFELAQRQNKLHLFLQSESDDLLDGIIAAATRADQRLEVIVPINQKLRILGYPGWPNFYTKVMNGLLRASDSQRALDWHRNLPAALRPDSDELAGLFSIFITDERKWVQKTLLSLYKSSPGMRLYDHLIPTLFEIGRASLARVWRKTFVSSQDLPCSPRSREFLEFMVRYFPQVKLDDEELVILDNKPPSTSLSPATSTSAFEERPHENLVAKWFASSWVSVDFAINIVYRLGTRSVGSQALQALALRESDARGVADRIGQVERLGIEIAQHTYCDAIIFLSRSGREDLLWDLLHCDIHPDEFNDRERRTALLNDATQQGDADRIQLLKAIELAVDNQPLPHELNVLMEEALRHPVIGKALAILDRMSALSVSISEENGSSLLRRVFTEFWHYKSNHIPGRPKAIIQGKENLDLVIGVVRQLAAHDVPIPISCWKQLLECLGRLGRLSDLEQLAIEFVELFTINSPPLLPVWEGEAIDPRFKRQLVPAEMPFSYRQHPVQEVFDASTQRWVVQWGFRKALSQPDGSLPWTADGKATDSNVARGVQILASLRDRGVLIDVNIVQGAVILAAANSMLDARWGQQYGNGSQTSPRLMKPLVEQAWGSELLPDVDQLSEEIEAKTAELLHWNQRFIGTPSDGNREPEWVEPR